MNPVDERLVNVIERYLAHNTNQSDHSLVKEMITTMKDIELLEMWILTQM